MKETYTLGVSARASAENQVHVRSSKMEEQSPLVSTSVSTATPKGVRVALVGLARGGSRALMIMRALTAAAVMVAALESSAREGRGPAAAVADLGRRRGAADGAGFTQISLLQPDNPKTDVLGVSRSRSLSGSSCVNASFPMTCEADGGFEKYSLCEHSTTGCGEYARLALNGPNEGHSRRRASASTSCIECMPSHGPRASLPSPMRRRTSTSASPKWIHTALSWTMRSCSIHVRSMSTSRPSSAMVTHTCMLLRWWDDAAHRRRRDGGAYFLFAHRTHPELAD